MKAFAAMVAIVLLALQAARHWGEDKHPLAIDVGTAAIEPAAARGMIDLCEKRQLAGDRYTLNPKPPPGKRVQERIVVCVETLPDGRLPPRPPFNVTVVRKAWSIA